MQNICYDVDVKYAPGVISTVSHSHKRSIEIVFIKFISLILAISSSVSRNTLRCLYIGMIELWRDVNDY